MSNRLKALLILYLSIGAVLFCGCNAFEGFDHDLRGHNSEGRRDEARLALNEAKYEKSKELYELLIADGEATDEVYRGKASSLAGLAGFNMFKALDILQNSSETPSDSAQIIFKCAQIIKDKELLQEAAEDISRLKSPSKDDLLFRGLLAAINSSIRITQAYDTNLNKKLDKPDKIDINTQQGIKKLWAVLYEELKPMLESAFNDLANGLSGQGADWSFVSPISQKSVSGKYTQANRKIISAVLSLSDALKLADTHFNSLSNDGFKSVILSLDGE